MIAEVRSNVEGYKVIALTHRHISLPELGQFNIPFSESDEIKARLESLKSTFQIDELLYLSTCNRVLFCFTSSHVIDEAFLTAFFHQVNPAIPTSMLEAVVPTIFHAQGQDAIQYLFEVATSIDSLVIGEREILRQLRQAYEACLQWGLTGDALRILIQHAIDTAKLVHSKTQIGAKALSIVALAIQEMRTSNLPSDARFLLVGAGQTNRLVARFLLKHAYQNVIVFNRSLDKAEELASWFDHGQAFQMDQLHTYDQGFDAAIVCTGSKSVLLDTPLFQKLVAPNSNPDCLLIDLAIPNNIDRSLGRIPGVKYIEVEDLRVHAKANLAFRQNELGAVRKIISTKLNAFLSEFHRREIEIAFHEMPEVVKSLRQEAIEDTFREKIDQLEPEGRELLEKMLNYLERKCISVPMRLAKGVVRDA